ncbi:hypothetical protein CDAR_47481 [Caerostris darwini]|uniref:Uncharacterized protein n=1 Tax=Caerostris darwini TaxID=1538125 RepID=A0AAV4M956_9ARAC|nr:hypothetical protein CDAR_47481 [Caerostris darwini]
MQIDLGCHPYQIQTTTRRQLMLQLRMNVACPFRCFQNITTSHHSFGSLLHIIRQELVYRKLRNDQCCKKKKNGRKNVPYTRKAIDSANKHAFGAQGWKSKRVIQLPHLIKIGDKSNLISECPKGPDRRPANNKPEAGQDPPRTIYGFAGQIKSHALACLAAYVLGGR